MVRLALSISSCYANVNQLPTNGKLKWVCSSHTRISQPPHEHHLDSWVLALPFGPPGWDLIRRLIIEQYTELMKQAVNVKQSMLTVLETRHIFSERSPCLQSLDSYLSILEVATPECCSIPSSLWSCFSLASGLAHGVTMRNGRRVKTPKILPSSLYDKWREVQRRVFFCMEGE